jgi:hypothetical protein
MTNMDYRDPPQDPNRMRTGMDQSSWAWIVGAIAVVVVLFLIFGLGGNQNTASNTGNPPAATTGQAPSTTGQAPSLPARPATPSTLPENANR